MGMLSAMYSGVAGLNAYGRALRSVADNVANLSTTGFKASRANFGGITAQSLSSSGGTPSQEGTGSRVLNMQVLMSQGSLKTTDVSTDMAINGKGFFAVRRVSTVTGTGATNTSQITSSGLRLQGYNVDSSDNLTQLTTDLDTWDYTTSSRIYDSLGVFHNLFYYFQKLTDKPTVTTAGTATVLRVAPCTLTFPRILHQGIG